MKIWNISFLSLILLLRCGSNPAFVKSPAEISKQIKRLLILPVYVDATLFPQLPSELKDKEYPEAFKRAVAKSLLEKIPLIDQVTKDLMLKNSLGLEVIVGTAADLKTLQLSPTKAGIYKDTGVTSKEIVYSWPFNRNWTPSPAGFVNLINKYQADGILIQSITVNQIWYSHTWNEGGTRQYSIMMPLDVLFYIPAMYDKTGSIVYGGERMDCQYYMANKHCDNHNGNRLVFLQRATAAEKKGYKAIPEDLPIIQKSISELTAERLHSILTDTRGSDFPRLGALSGVVAK